VEHIRNEHGPDQMVVVGDRMCTDRLIAHMWGAILSVVLSRETREPVDELSEAVFPSLIVKNLGDLLT
jgi:predicted HAD superfamily phosphohydrolase YqeG